MNFLLISFFFLLLFIVFVFFFNLIMNVNFDCKAPFECGFDSYQSNRSLFSLRFFSLTLIFLIFDMEVVFIFPLMFFYSYFKFFFIFFFLMLILGLLLEWNQGGLNWK